MSYPDTSNSFVDSRLGLNIVTLEVNEIENAEKQAMEWYSSKGYYVVKLKGLRVDLREDIETHFECFDGVDFSEPGLPDLFAFYEFWETGWPRGGRLTARNKKADKRFVEVKSESDSLRATQLEWLSKYQGLEAAFDIAIVKGN